MTLNNKEGIKQRSWTAIMALVSKSVSKSVLVKCKIKGGKKFGWHYSSELKKQELCGTFESKGGGVGGEELQPELKQIKHSWTEIDVI